MLGLQLCATVLAIVLMLPIVVIETYAGMTGDPKYLLYAIAELAIFIGVIWVIWF